ncbi:CoA transferase [Skermanella mucosa]|uniref:CaiB/BaiF CoA transferase family protein n=1 Tax=Skermanella mucosa TaxID=1789672 RepID=UPI00192CAEB7|nr:CoA transferase [Skermanella mucosa]UEM21989.1 CoA transferase [Skermanella mucosa]
MSGPLSGIRILEAGHMLAGPYCGMLLADLGAEVIKIESPEGDIARRLSPHSVGPHNAYFASLNRNKRSVVLDLGSAEGQAALGRLAASSHGLLTNMRPAVIRKLGLTYDSLSVHNPRIACLALTGYGLDGPYADRPAYDYVIQALVGIMALTGDPGAPPVKCGYSAVDNSAGIMGALGLVAKILEGKGGQIDVSLFDTMLSQLNYVAGAWLNAGESPSRYESGGHPYIVPAQIFETADGHLALFITHDDFWRRFAREAGRPEWLSDARFGTMAGRTANRDLVIRAVGSLLRTRGTAEWVGRLAPLGIVVAGVERLEDALAGDLARSHDMVVSIPTGDGDLAVVGNPIRFPGEPTRYGPPPLLGEHTAALLAEGG